MKKLLLINLIFLTLSTQAQQSINGKQVYVLGEDTICASIVTKYKVDTVLQVVDDSQTGAFYLLKVTQTIISRQEKSDEDRHKIKTTSQFKTHFSSQSYRLKDSTLYDFLGYEALEKCKKKEPEKVACLSERELDYFEEQAKIQDAQHEKEDRAYSGPFYLDKRDSQQYKIITIGEQTWFAQNLNYEMENSWPNEIETYSAKEFGRYYTLEAAQKACPAGWHLPSDAEWQQMEMEFGMSKAQAIYTGKRGNIAPFLKHNRSWFYKSEEGKGFNAVAAGAYMGSNYVEVGIFATWWTANKTSELKAWTRGIHYSSTAVIREEKNKDYGFSVRCVKDRYPSSLNL